MSLSPVRISEQTFADIKGSGHGVPRFNQGGETLDGILKVSATRELKCCKTGEVIKVKCTQDNPVHVIIIK